jgi:hypothetical protein
MIEFGEEKDEKNGGYPAIKKAPRSFAKERGAKFCGRRN